MALLSSRPEVDPRASTSTAHSLDLPSLQPLSHAHPLLTAPDFSADTFLLSRIHIPLDELRGELRQYLSVLREELVQLINDDYEEFISLGTGLKGEGERLRRLERPLRALAEDVDGVKAALSRQEEAVQGKLDERAALREERALLDLLQRLFDTLARAEKLLNSPAEDDDRSKLVSRVAGEYTQVVYLLSKARAEGCAVADSVAPRVEAIKASLSKDLSTLLVASLQHPSDSIPQLKQCLRTYEVIESWEEAEAVVRKEVQAFCRATITSTALHVPQSPMVPVTPHPNANPFDKAPRLSDDSPLASLYNRILAQVELYQPLMTVAGELSDRFNFFAAVIYPEVAASISEKLGGTIFAAGRPDELHKHYTTTHSFISLLESLAPSVRAVEAMRTSSAYEAFERRWQLPVYYQLRWKEIVGTFEASLSTPSPAGEWALPQAAAAWKALETCWSDDVYIPELAPRFWRLSLQIISRFNGWLRTTIDGYKLGEEEPTQEDAALKFAAAAIVDLDMLATKVPKLRVAELGVASHLAIPTQPYAEKTILILSRRSIETLKLVRSVASQFRATPAKSTEITPSYFIPSILKPLHELFNSRSVLKDKYQSEWSSNIVDQVFVAYASILASVRKTEDLLRRHRKSKKGGFSLFGNSAPEKDDDKEEERFQKQMTADIEALASDARGLGVQVEELEGWKELVEVVTRPAE
ncbi:oligomeric golgi complex component, COG2-domain-containing protein [Naematelia encephala]|uniref:Conserved oligomeric Golgi complex subunit 2 n=1 Tax=Naematelia encephala TaxID=71784 RepID=A0A1Y2BNS8_9TREE|nr:oligomeric golgi complex component, COG2-domain-containing protein [Naematelia encephala]